MYLTQTGCKRASVCGPDLSLRTVVVNQTNLCRCFRRIGAPRYVSIIPPVVRSPLSAAECSLGAQCFEKCQVVEFSLVVGSGVQDLLRLLPNDVQYDFLRYSVYTPEPERTQQQRQVGSAVYCQITFETTFRDVNGVTVVLNSYRKSAVA
jgi:hypothetical protein